VEDLCVPDYRHTLEVDAPPARVFEVIDDFKRTPQWLSRCTGLDEVAPGPHKVGDKLRYSYKQGRQSGTMDGQIVRRDPDRRLTLAFTDKTMDVTVDFATDPADGERTSLTHEVTIATKGLGKAFTPLIKRQLPEQVVDAMTRLKALVEGG